jgi:arsenate reductase
VTVTVYGIRNCDTCRRALRWLEQRGVAARLHDLRADGLDAPRLESWLGKTSWQDLLNRRSTTWRQLPERDRDVADAEAAARLLLAHPTLVKRPLVEHGGALLIGFREADWAERFPA